MVVTAQGLGISESTIKSWRQLKTDGYLLTKDKDQEEIALQMRKS